MHIKLRQRLTGLYRYLKNCEYFRLKDCKLNEKILQLKESINKKKQLACRVTLTHIWIIHFLCNQLTFYRKYGFCIKLKYLRDSFVHMIHTAFCAQLQKLYNLARHSEQLKKKFVTISILFFAVAIPLHLTVLRPSPCRSVAKSSRPTCINAERS